MNPKRRDTLIHQRIVWLGIGFMSGLGIITIRLFFLQVIQRNAYYEESTKNFTRIETITVPRGEIVDCSGTLLATNRPVTNIYWRGSGSYRLTPEQRNRLQALYTILESDKLDSLLTQRITYAERHKRELLIAQDISFEQLSLISEQCTSSGNIVVKNLFERHYPYKKMACHLIGYLGTDAVNKKIGQTGLEKHFHEKLRGKEGALKKTINSVGSPIDQHEIAPMALGDTIQTTLDIGLQQTIERIFPHDQAGTFILMDPRNGALRAVLSRPSFDPSIFLKPISHEAWHELQEKRAFINRAFSACYPPASLFKLVTVSTGIEHGIISPDLTCNCTGKFKFGNRLFRCNRVWGHGEINTKEALAKSCNIVFYEIGKRVSIDTLADYAHRFGLGEPSGLLLPENSGFIPTSSWKIRTKGERWWQGETVMAAIGQTFMLATPLQLVRMTASIYTGKLVRPRLLETEPEESVPLAIQPSTRSFLNEAMKLTITDGTGRMKSISDMEIFAKTGTAQTSSLANRNLGGKHLEHAWFVANFAYKDNNPLTLMVLVEHVGSARIATNMAKQFFNQYRELMDKRARALH